MLGLVGKYRVGMSLANVGFSKCSPEFAKCWGWFGMFGFVIVGFSLENFGFCWLNDWIVKCWD